MKYSECRLLIESGDVLAWSEGGPPTSWRNIQLSLVKMGTMSQFNHVGMAYVLAGRVFVIEAVVPIIRIYPLSKEVPFYFVKTPFRLGLEHEEKLLQRVGLPYSKWEAIKSAFSKDTDGMSVWECAKLVNQTLIDFDPGFQDIHDTPGSTIEYLMTKHNCSVLAVTAD